VSPTHGRGSGWKKTRCPIATPSSSSATDSGAVASAPILDRESNDSARHANVHGRRHHAGGLYRRVRHGATLDSVRHERHSVRQSRQPRVSDARAPRRATVAEARAELDTIRASWRRHPQTNDKRGVEVSPLTDEVLQQLRPIVVALMAAVTLVLLIACANVAGLLIGRSDARQREIAVRTALGAGPGRLLRQLVTENCVLAMLGALAGMAIAQISLPSLIAASPVAFPTFVRPQLSLRVLAFGIVIALVSGVMLGIAPMMHARLPRLGEALKTSSRGGSSGMRSQRLRSALVIVEVALAVVLLAGAGLMIRSIQKLAAIDPGFDAANVLLLNATIPRQTAPPAAPGGGCGARSVRELACRLARSHPCRPRHRGGEPCKRSSVRRRVGDLLFRRRGRDGRRRDDAARVHSSGHAGVLRDPANPTRGGPYLPAKRRAAGQPGGHRQPQRHAPVLAESGSDR
jgi:hypothetical protein